MDDSIHPSPKPRRVQVVAALVLSGAALAALLHFQGEPRAHPVDVSGDSAARPLPAPAEVPPMQGGISGLAIDRRAIGAAPTVDVAPAMPSEIGDANRVVVPDFAGKRLSVARREARALGLRLVARDAYGERVAPYDAASYRVRSQVTEAGTRVPPDAVVHVRARAIDVSYGEGY